MITEYSRNSFPTDLYYNKFPCSVLLYGYLPAVIYLFLYSIIYITPSPPAPDPALESGQSGLRMLLWVSG